MRTTKPAPTPVTPWGGVHLIKYPTGRFGFVGSLPPALGNVVEATTADVMAGRACEIGLNRIALTVKFPSFETAAAAWAHAESRNVARCASPTCACRTTR